MNNQKYFEFFSNPADKEKAFDRIAEMFYDKNFSSATKAEIELLMFSIYMDATVESCKKTDNTIDYNACSDFEMGKELGIPQEKVRSLKIKKQARYPIEFDWRKSLLTIEDSIRYDKEKNKIIIPTRDPNLYNEIRNYIEEHGGYIEIQRSGNFIQIRPEHFFMLMYEEMDENEKKKCQKNLKSELQKRNKNNIIPEATSATDVLRLIGQLMSFAGSAAGIIQVIKEFTSTPLVEIFLYIFR